MNLTQLLSYARPWRGTLALCSLLMLVAPTFVRYWEGSFEGKT